MLAEARLESSDVDRDGFAEDVLSNTFVEAVVQPHRGARLISLRDGRGTDRLAQPGEYIMGGKYVLLGGAEDLLEESGSPGELWKAALEREPGLDGTSVRYLRTMKNPKGVRFEKNVRVESWLPGVASECTLRYDGAPHEDRNGESRSRGAGGESSSEGDGRRTADRGAKKDNADLTYGVRMSTAVEGTGSESLFELVLPGRNERVRYHRPPHGNRWRWRDWRNERFGLRGGFFVSRHEASGRAMLVVFDARRALCLDIRSDLPGPELILRHRTVTLRPGTKRTYGAAFLSGDAAAVEGASALLLSRSRSGRELAVIVRTARRIDRLVASVGTREGRRRVTLRPREVPHAGTVYSAVVETSAVRRACSCRVKVGGDRLAAALEAL